MLFQILVNGEAPFIRESDKTQISHGRRIAEWRLVERAQPLFGDVGFEEAALRDDDVRVRREFIVVAVPRDELNAFGASRAAPGVREDVLEDPDVGDIRVERDAQRPWSGSGETGVAKAAFSEMSSRPSARSFSLMHFSKRRIASLLRAMGSGMASPPTTSRARSGWCRRTG